MLGGEIFPQFADVPPQRVRDIMVDVAMLALKAVQRAIGRVAQIRGKQRVEFDARSRGGLVTALAVGRFVYRPLSVGSSDSIRLSNVSALSGRLSLSFSHGMLWSIKSRFRAIT